MHSCHQCPSEWLPPMIDRTLVQEYGVASKPAPKFNEQMDLAVDSLCQLLFGASRSNGCMQLACHMCMTCSSFDSAVSLSARGTHGHARAMCNHQPKSCSSETSMSHSCILCQPQCRAMFIQGCLKASCRLGTRLSCCAHCLPAWSRGTTSLRLCSSLCLVNQSVNEQLQQADPHTAWA